MQDSLAGARSRKKEIQEEMKRLLNEFIMETGLWVDGIRVDIGTVQVGKSRDEILLNGVFHVEIEVKL